MDTGAWVAFIAGLRARLRSAFAALDAHFDRSPAPLAARPRPAEWSALEIAEHVALVDHYLLLLASKIRDKALARARRGEEPPAEPSRCAHLEKLAARDMHWESPLHMLPLGRTDAADIRARLARDLQACERLLDDLPSGEGALHRIRMSVVGEDDRLDLYQFLYVIALHAERHVAQIERVLG